MGLQIKVTNGDGQLTEIIAFTPGHDEGLWVYRDEDGDLLQVGTSQNPTSGPGVVIGTKFEHGAHIPLAEVEDFITQVRRMAEMAKEEAEG